VKIARRDAIGAIGFLALIGFVLAGFPFDWLATFFVLLQIAVSLDIILLVVGRFFPSATLWGIATENWLGPLPWNEK